MDCLVINLKNLFDTTRAIKICISPNINDGVPKDAIRGIFNYLFSFGNQIINDKMILTKLAGIGAIILGLAMIIFFPYTLLHQTEGMANLGILIGIVFLGIGLFLLSL